METKLKNEELELFRWSLQTNGTIIFNPLQEQHTRCDTKKRFFAAATALAHLHGDVPGQVDIGLVLIHPHLGHTQGVTPRVESDVTVIRFLHPGNVSNPGARQHLHTASTQPHLEVHSTGEININ